MRRLVVIAAVLSLVLAGAGQAEASGGWSIEPTVSVSGSFNNLWSVSCVKQSDCMAVGDYLQPGGPASPLIEHWDGSSWTLQSVSGPSPHTGLYDVSCATADYCLALGASGVAGGVRWNGKSWHQIFVPRLSGPQGSGMVSCPAVNACIAIGERGKQGFTPIAESWNGNSWTALPAPVKVGAATVLRGISCTSVSACTAVGGGLAERWDGSAWTLQNAISGPYIFLTSVSCPNATTCTAFGQGKGGPAAEQWANGTWTLQKVPRQSSSSYAYNMFNDVSCVSASQCTAVGLHANEMTTRMLIYHWNGSTWSHQEAPSPDGALNPWSVSCQVGGCMAVGILYNNGGGGGGIFAAHN